MAQKTQIVGYYWCKSCHQFLSNCYAVDGMIHCEDCDAPLVPHSNPDISQLKLNLNDCVACSICGGDHETRFHEFINDDRTII